MLFTAVSGTDESEDEKGRGKLEEQGIKKDDPLQYTSLDLNRVISNQLLPSGPPVDKTTKTPFQQQDTICNSSATSSSYPANNTDGNHSGKESRRQSVTMDTFKAFDHSILQPNTLRKNALMQQHLEKALSEKVSPNLHVDALGLRKGSVQGEWKLGAGGNPEASDGARVRRASMPGGTVIGSERRSIN